MRRVLHKTEVLTGEVTTVDHARRVAVVEPLEGESVEVPYDLLVMAAGSVARTLPIPGLAETGIGFSTIGEAIFLRNHVLSRLDLAYTTSDPVRRRRALTFVFVGGGYAGVEAFAELEDMAHAALRFYPTLSRRDMRWVLVEAAGRILPEVSVSMAAYTVQQLVERGMDIRLNTRVESMAGGHVTLSDGESFDAETIVWTAGVEGQPAGAPVRVSRSTRRAGCGAPRSYASPGSRTCGARATAPPSPTCRRRTTPTRCAAPAPSTPYARRSSSRTTL